MLKIKKRKRCLFINEGKIIDKLKQESNFTSKYKAILFDIQKQKRSLSEVIEKFGIKEIIIETSQINKLTAEIIREITELRLKGIKVYESEDFFELITKRVPIVKVQLNEYLTDDIFSIKMNQKSIIVKRIFDLLFSICLLPFALPLTIIGCILTLITSKGGMFFSQERVGKEGKTFKIYKIRTMVINQGGFTTKNDARITPIGKILRLTKIDELPQLYNIIKGDMSLIGPRPEVPKYVKQYIEENPYFNLRHMIKPGVSGWSQIHLPKATPLDSLKKLEYDLYYIKNYSLAIDLKVIKETIKIILTLNSN